MKKEMLVSSSWYPVTGCMGMVQPTTGGLEWTSGSTKGVVKQWNRPPREVIDAPSPSVLERHLDNALNKLL